MWRKQTFEAFDKDGSDEDVDDVNNHLRFSGGFQENIHCYHLKVINLKINGYNLMIDYIK